MESKRKNFKPGLLRGFSLPELIVTIAIISIVTGIILFRYSDFNSSVLLTSQAYELALDLREVQTYGLSVRSSGSGNFDEEYGMYFDIATLDNGYIFFQDIGPNNPVQYNGGEEIDTIYLDPRYEIASICVNTSIQPCPLPNQINNLAVSFKRPNFDAQFYSSNVMPINEAHITISPLGDTATRTVSIYPSGRIDAR